LPGEFAQRRRWGIDDPRLRPARVRCHGVDAGTGSSAAAPEFACEDDLGDLGVGVGAGGRPGGGAEPGSDPASPGNQRAEVHHACSAGDQRRPESCGEGPGAEVVHGDGQVETLSAALVRPGVHASVVDQQVYRFGAHPPREGRDAEQRAQFEEFDGNGSAGARRADRSGSTGSAGLVAGGKDDAGSGCHKAECRCKADPAAGAGDDGAPSGQVRQLQRR